MAKKKEEEVSFADQLLDMLKSSQAKKTQDSMRAKAKAGGVNRDLLRMQEIREQQEAVKNLILNQAKATGAIPSGNPMGGGNPQMQGGSGQDTLMGQGGGLPAPQGQSSPVGNAPQLKGPQGMNLPAIQGPTNQVPTRPGTSLAPVPQTENLGRPPIDAQFEEIRGLPRGQSNMPSTQVNPAAQAQSAPNQAPNLQGDTKPSGGLPPNSPGIMDLLRFLAARTGVGAAGLAMSPTEVAPGTYAPNEDVMPREPVALDPVEVIAPRSSSKAPSSASKGKGVQPVLPGRKPSVEGSEGSGLNIGINKSFPDVKYIQMTVPVPKDADDKKVQEFVKLVGGEDWGFRDDYVGEMQGHPAEKR